MANIDAASDFYVLGVKNQYSVLKYNVFAKSCKLGNRKFARSVTLRHAIWFSFDNAFSRHLDISSMSVADILLCNGKQIPCLYARDEFGNALLVLR